jgi:hypothetical protein
MKLQLKVAIPKTILVAALLFIGSFAVINAGMYFFLSRTHAGPAARKVVSGETASERAADSLQTASENDSSAVNGDVLLASTARADSTASAFESPLAAEPITDSGSGDTTELLAETGTVEAPDDTPAVAVPSNPAELAKLAKALEAMKPDAAAAIAAQLDTDQIVALVMKMKDRTAGRMLAAFPPELAAQVALQMSQASMQAGR